MDKVRGPGVLARLWRWCTGHGRDRSVLSVLKSIDASLCCGGSVGNGDVIIVPAGFNAEERAAFGVLINRLWRVQKDVSLREAPVRPAPLDVVGIAHELWVYAQLLPGEGISDGVDRILECLKENGIE